jgi:structural maintenance of chromosome 2
VDAALDLSHTQNIGRMIKDHFPNAQFVIVSLKEGFFSNADVLFRTSFVDGSSTVRRYCNAGAQRKAVKDGEGPVKKKRAAEERENVAA